jgi:hypothetical protein
VGSPLSGHVEFIFSQIGAELASGSLKTLNNSTSFSKKCPAHRDGSLLSRERPMRIQRTKAKTLDESFSYGRMNQDLSFKKKNSPTRANLEKFRDAKLRVLALPGGRDG